MIKVYELMSRLEKLQSGAEVMISGIKTIDDLTDEPPLGEDNHGSKEYPITEIVLDIEAEGNRVYLQF